MFISTIPTASNLLSITEAIGHNFKRFITDGTDSEDALSIVGMATVFRAKEPTCFRILDLATLPFNFLVTFATSHYDGLLNNPAFPRDMWLRCSSSLHCTFPGTIYPCMVTRNKVFLALRAGTRLFVSRLVMEVSHSARVTAFASPCHLLTAIWAYPHSLIGKVYIVYLAVTINTKSDAIGDIETRLFILCPGLNMMCVYLPFSSTLLTGIVITNIDSSTPCLEFGSQSCALTLKRLAIFPSRGINPYPEFLRTLKRTELLTTFLGDKGFTAEQAFSSIYDAAMRPASFRAVVRGVGSVGMGFIFLATYFTGKVNATSFHISFLLKELLIVLYMYYTRYVDMMQAKASWEASPEYIDVICTRWENLTHQTATLLERIEEHAHA